MRTVYGWIAGILIGLSGVAKADDGVPARLHTELWHGPSNSIQVDGVCSGDLDGDGNTELAILTRQSVPSPEASDDTETSPSELENNDAELRIARWDGEDYRVLASEVWQVSGQDTRAQAVICTALDAAAGLEVITLVLTGDDTEIRVWSWDGAAGGLQFRTSRVWRDVSMVDIAAADFDGDGTPELVLGGTGSGGEAFGGNPPALWVMRWDGETITEEAEYVWSDDDVDSVATTPALYAVAAADLDGSDPAELLTLTEVANAFDLRVWHLEAGAIVLRDSWQWRPLGDSYPRALAVGDLDGALPLEIVAAGSTASEDETLDSDHRRFGSVALLHWNGETLALQADDVWQTERGNVELFGASVADVDADGLGEAVVAGPEHVSPGRSVMRIYDWASGDSDPEVALSTEWLPEPMLSSFVYGVYSGDLDGADGAEVLTYGRSYVSLSGTGYRDYAQLDIWGHWEDFGYFALYWLEDVLWFRGWPFYQAFRDTLPMPWPPLIYGVVAVIAFAFVSFVLVRALRRWIKRPH